MLAMAVIGRIGTRWARRTRFLAERLWLVSALEVAWIARRHWRRLAPDERRRLIELARKSKGRTSKLNAGERREAAELLEKLDYAQFGGTVAGTLLPFRPLSRLVQFALGRPMRSRRRDPGAAEN
jgi:hypothetical protein